MPQNRRPPPASDQEDFPDSGSTSSSISQPDLNEDRWIPPSVEFHASRAEYRAALQTIQLKHSELQGKHRMLQIKYAELAEQFRRSKNSHQSKSYSSRIVLSDKDKQIAQIAKKFGVLNEVFMLSTAFLVSRPATNSMDPNRYTSEATSLQGLIAELFEEVPPDLHEMMRKSPDFRDIFLKQLNAGRRSMIHQLRSETATKIFGQPSQHYQAEANREILPAFQAALKFTGATEYSKYAPILFPDGKRDMRQLFKCDHLVKMLKSILFGPSSLSSKKAPLPRTQGKVWGVTFVTPGAISLVAILAIFLHSPDKEFAPIGVQTKIPYGRWFSLFKAYLINHSDKQTIQTLYKWWNGRLFTSGKEAALEDGESSGMDEAEKGIDFNGSDGDRMDGTWDTFVTGFDNALTLTESTIPSVASLALLPSTANSPSHHNEPLPVIPSTPLSSSPQASGSLIDQPCAAATAEVSTQAEVDLADAVDAPLQTTRKRSSKKAGKQRAVNLEMVAVDSQVKKPPSRRSQRSAQPTT